jgi:hypothetical protein
MPQKSAIWAKLSVVLSTSQTAVALAISGFDIGSLLYKPFPGREKRLRAFVREFRDFGEFTG